MTLREKQISALRAKGNTHLQIAKLLFLSKKTVACHLNHVNRIIGYHYVAGNSKLAEEKKWRAAYTKYLSTSKLTLRK
jgi:DNA-binding NarL/FixJ family response regulator